MSENAVLINAIAHIRTDLTGKFGLPRQSNVVPSLAGCIVFETEYRSAEALRGLEEYSHLWIIWQFSENTGKKWSPTVRPPVLGGNTRVGVFATRSSFRPNSLALSCVKLEKVELDSKEGPVIYVSGIDMMDNTPIFDIKPYIPKWDSIPEAKNGFTGEREKKLLKVEISKRYTGADETSCDMDDVDTVSSMLGVFSEKQRLALLGLLEQDPRPAYKAEKNEPDRIYGFEYAGFEIRFTVDKDVLYIVEITTGGNKNEV